MKRIPIFLIVIAIITSCKKDDPSGPDPMGVEMKGLSFNSGKNTYSESFSEATRQFTIHVPIIYERETASPLVLAFHDQENTSDDYYNSSEWAKKADLENCIVIYPAAMNYPITQLGKTISFWAEFEAGDKIQEGANILDDVLFIEELYELLKLTFTIDENQVFLTGHGQGGDFVKSKLMTDIDNIVAASAVSGSLGTSEFLVHVNKIFNPLLAILGSDDEIELNKANRVNSFPLDELGIFDDPYLSEQIDNMLITLQLHLVGEIEELNNYTKLNYSNSTVNQDTEYVGYIIKGLDRSEAKTDNNNGEISAVDLFWEFFQKHGK